MDVTLNLFDKKKDLEKKLKLGLCGALQGCTKLFALLPHVESTQNLTVNFAAISQEKNPF